MHRPYIARQRIGALCAAAAVGAFSGEPAARAQESVPQSSVPQSSAARESARGNESPSFPATLTLEQAMNVFRTHGLDLLITEAAVQSAQGDVRIAGAVPNPQISAGFGKGFGYDSNLACQQQPGSPGGPVQAGCSDKQYFAGISDNAAITDTIYGLRGLRQRVASAALRAAKMGRADAERVVGAAVKQAYIAATLAKRQFAFVEQVLASNQQTLDLFQIRYDKGAINEADLARIDVQKLEAEQALATARQAVRTTKVTLAFLLGVRGLVPAYDVNADTLNYAVPSRLEAPSRESLLQAAFDHRPDLRGYGFQTERARASIDLAKRQRLPPLTFSLQYSQWGTGQYALSPPLIAASVSLPIPLFYQQQGEIARAEADLRTQSFTRNKTQAQVVNDVETAVAALEVAREQVERMQGRLLERAGRARELVQIQYLKGAATLLEYLDAQRTFISTNTEYLQDLSNYWNAVIALEQAVGTEFIQ